MPEVTHLSETFYEEFAAVTTQLRDSRLNGHEYGAFYDYCKEKDLAQATAHLDSVKESWKAYLHWLMTEGREKHEKLYDALIVDIRSWHQAVYGLITKWHELMDSNGGSERVTGLVKESSKKLRPARPLPFAPINR